MVRELPDHGGKVGVGRLITPEPEQDASHARSLRPLLSRGARIGEAVCVRCETGGRFYLIRGVAWCGADLARGGASTGSWRAERHPAPHHAPSAFAPIFSRVLDSDAVDIQLLMPESHGGLFDTDCDSDAEAYA